MEPEFLNVISELAYSNIPDVPIDRRPGRSLKTSPFLNTQTLNIKEK